MPVTGTLGAMPITEVFDWLARARRGGTLRVERRKAGRRVHLEDGKIVGCSSNEPLILLGQFLLSHGRVTEAQLRGALEQQETTGERIGEILVREGTVTQAELDQFLAAKAKEIVLSLFDWEDASFRFDTDLAEDRYAISVQFKVSDILPQGIARREEMQRFHEVFHDDQLVLVRNRREPPAELKANPVASRIFDSIDGRRTLAEICLHSRTSVYLTTKFLFQLHKMLLVGVKKDPKAPRVARSTGEIRVAAAGGAGIAAAAPVEDPETQLERDLHVALGLLEQNQCELALELLADCEQRHPGEERVRQAIAKAESEFVKSVRKAIDVNMVPRLLGNPDEMQARSPEASFLPSLIDGVSDVKSIMYLAPMRTVEVLRALKQMVDQGMIELRA